MHAPISNSESLLKLTEIINVLENQKLGFFMNKLWFMNFIDTVLKKDGDSCLFIVSDEENKQKKVILPLIVTHRAGQPTNIKSLTNYYSPIYKTTSHEFNNSDFENCFKQIRRLNWNTIELRPLPFEDILNLRNILKKTGLPSIPFFCFGNWYLPINKRSYDQYFSELSSQVKNTVNRKTKKFDKIPGSTIEILTSPTDLNKAVDAFQTVYQSSWKQPEPYPDFIPGLIKIAAEQGSMRVGIAYLNGKPIASQLWIVADNSAYIFKLAYDEAYKQHSAGTVLTAKMMQYVIDHDKVDVVDYLCGDDDYKKDWMSHRRERWGLLIFNTANIWGLLMLCREMPKYWLKVLFTFLKK